MSHRVGRTLIRALCAVALIATLLTTAAVVPSTPAAAQAGVTNDCPGGDLAVALYGGSGPTVGLYGNTAAHLGGAAGYCVQLIDKADWAIMTAAEFEQFDVLWFGNDNCSGATTADFNEAISSRAVWETAIDPAKVMIAGGDYDWHYNGNDASARAITQQMITTLSGGSKPGLVLQAGCYSANGFPWFQLLGGTFAGLNHGTISGGDPASAADLYAHDFNTSNGYVWTDWVFGWSCHGAMSITPGSAIEDYNLQPIFKVSGQDCFYMSDPNFAPMFSEMTITKSDPAGVMTVGQVVTYSFTVTNTGTLTLTGLVVTDTELASVTCDTTTLAAGESTNCSGDYTITSEDVTNGTITNTATAAATDSNLDPVGATSNTVVSNVYPPCMEAANVDEHLQITGDASFNSGTGEFTLTPAANNQTGTLMSRSRIDLSLPFELAFELNLGSSDAGADGIGFVFHNDPDGVDAIGAYGGGMGMAGIKNSIGIEWDTWDNSAITGHDDIANDHTGVYDPELILADPTYYGTTAQLLAPVDLGNIEDGAWRAASVAWNPTAQELTYTFDGSTITTLSIDLLGAHIGGNYGHFGFSASTGAANNLQQVRFTSIDAVVEPSTLDCDGDGVADNVDDDPYDPCVNPAQAGWTALGTNDCDNDGVTVAGGDSDDFDACALASADDPTCLVIDITKGSPTGTLAEGETITYTFTVTNNGTRTLSSIVVNDDVLTSVTCDATTLAPTESTSCSGDYLVDQDDVDAGEIVNTASVNANGPYGTSTSDTSNTVNSSVPQSPSIGITKSITAGTLAEGETVIYTIVVTNTGDVTLTNIAVTDALLGGAVACGTTTLAPGASTNCTAPYVVTQANVDAGEIVNTASVDSDDPNGDPVINSVTETTSITQTPSIGIAKSVTSGTLAAGETVTYTIAVTNTGDVTLDQIVVTDTLLGGVVPCLATSLAPAGETTCTGTYDVTQADVDAGEIVNTASVDSDDPTDAPITGSVVETTAVSQTPGIDVDKQPPTGTLEVDETITYPFVVTNTGNVTLTNVSVSDPTADPVTCDDATLAPGASTNCSATYLITQDDVDAGGVTNTATASGDDPQGDPTTGSDSITQGIDQTPAIDVDKQPPSGDLEVGETLIYPMVVTNTGNVTLTDVAVTDVLVGPVTCGSATLAPGVSTNCTATYVVTQADVDAGEIVNTANVTADDPNDDPTTNSDSVTTPIAASPTMQVVKAVTAGFLSVGETIEYTISVTNTGNVTLSNVAVDDPLLGGDVPCASTTLAPGASTTCVGTYVVTQTDVDNGEILNEATATADPPVGDPIDTIGTLTSAVPQNPAIETSKALTAGTLALGETITYTITITNTGDVTLSDIAANDPMLGGAVPCGAASLAPTASTTCVGTYEVTQADVDAGQIVNTATGSGDDPNGDPQSDPTVLTSAVPQNPAVAVAKALTAGTLAVGETVTYTMTVTNTGDVTLSNVAVDDPMLGGDVPCTDTTLAPAASTTCAGTYEVTQADLDAGQIDNTASVTADDPDGDPVTNTGSVSTAVPQNPALGVAKSVTAGLLEAGETVTYTIVVTNTGDVTVTNLAVNDPLLGGAVSCADTTLAPNAQTSCVGTYVVTQSDVDAGEIVNTADADADDPNGDPVVADVTVSTDVDQTPAIDVDKQPPSPAPEAGVTITYPFVVTNTGNVTLDDIVVSDPLTGPVSCDDAQLAPGASTNCSATYEVTQADVDAGQIDNTATVTATDPNNAAVSGTDSVTTGVDQTPAIDIDKQPPTGVLEVGQTLTYTMVVTNTGNVTLSDVAVTDPKVGVVSCDVASLSPAGTATCTGSYTVTQDDVDAGGITNTAGVTATDPNDDPVADTDSVATPIAASPIIDVTKAITDGTLAAGETLEYTITVVNTGNVTLTAVAVDDPLLGGNVACDVTTLSPGASASCVGTYVVTQADVDAGELLNEATATAQPPSGDPIAGMAVLNSEIDRNPAIALSKSVTAGSLAVGEDVAYTITATNIGDVTLSDVAVSDPLLGGPVSCSSTTLAPGASTACVGTYTVTQADLDAGDITNFASVTSSAPDGTNPEAVASVVTSVPQNPSLTVAKAITDGVLAEGEVITYTLTITNSGDVTLTGITATDPLLGGLVACADSALAPGASTTCVDTYVVTQADVDAGEIENVASASAFQPNGDAVDGDVTLVSDVPQSPSMSVIKVLTDGTLALGETLTYTVTANNDGDVTLTNLVVDDPMLGGPLSCVATTVAPGVSTTCTGTYVVTQADVDAGEIVNDVDATADDPAGDPVTATDTLTSAVPQNPSVDVAKSVTAGLLEVGETITYTVVVTNTGDVTLSNVAVDDPLLGGPVACVDASIAPLAQTTCTGTYVVTQVDVDAGGISNTAAVTADAPDGSEQTDDVVELTDIERLPAIDLDKQPPTGLLEAGETITYPFVATNTGNVTLTNIAVSDPLADPVTCDDGVLAPGATTACTATYLVTQADVDAGSIVNSATVTATSPGGSTVDASDGVTTGLAQTPAIDLDKQTPAVIPPVGETVTYQMTVTNTGNVTLTDVAVDDPLLGGPVACVLDTLGPGASTSCSGDYVVTQTDVDAGEIINTATASATDTNDGPVGDTDTVESPIPASPLFEVTKAISAGELVVDETITYTISVLNTGNVTLSNVAVDDPLLGGDVPCVATTLAPGESTTCSGTYVVTQADVDAGEILNEATASATAPSGDGISGNATLTSPIAQNPSVDVAKSVTSGLLEVGETITYTVVVTNTGDVTLSDVAVDDPLLGGPVTCVDASIAPLAETTCTGTYVVTQADVDAGGISNTATVSATAPDGSPQGDGVVEQTDIERLPALDLDKQPPVGTLEAGETITYPFVVTNTGNVTLTGVTVADPLVDPVTCDAAELAPGETTDCSATYTITQADVDAGSIVNSAEVTATSPSGATVTGTDEVTQGLAQTPAIDIDKRAPAAIPAFAETLTYFMTVTNTGNVTLTDVAVDDPLLGGPVACPQDTLAPGESMECSGTYLVSQADVDSGLLVNTATVTATDTNDGPVTNDDTVESPIPASPLFEVTKAITDGELVLDETITYTITVWNTGNVTLSNVAVDDPLLGGNVPCVATTLPVNFTTTCTGTYVVTQDDVDAGEILNEATATATAPSGAGIEGAATLTSPIAQNPSVDVAKSVTDGLLEVGETVTYTVVVTNTGDVTLSDVAVDDPLLGGPVTCVDATLAPLAETTCTGTYVVTQADVDAGGITNTAAVSASAPDGSPQGDDVVEQTDIERLPAVDLDKQPPVGTLEAGETVTYPFVVTNTGNVTLTEIAVADPLVDPVTCDAAELAPGETTDCSATYTITQGDVDAGGVVNAATVSATSPDGSSVDGADEVTTGLDQTPAIDIDKQAPADTPALGDTLTYVMTVTNTGNVTLSDIAVDDPLLGGPVTCDADTLAPGETAECSGTYTVTQADVDSGLLANTASVSATDTNDGPVTDTDTVESPIPASPLFEVTKTLTDGELVVDETITYTVTVVNTGNVTLSSVTVDDPLLGGDVPCDPTTLTPGQSSSCVGTYVVTQADVDAGEILNEATAAATAPSGDEIDGNATLTSEIPQNPSLDLVKAEPTGELAVDETITYTVTATNTGDVTLDELVVDDPLLGGALTCDATVLAPGESADCTGTYVVTQSDVDAGQIDNVATATAAAPDGSPQDATSNEVTTDIEQLPELRTDKAQSGGELSVGSTLFYTVTVTNVGNVTMTNVIVDDPMLVNFTCPELTLAPGGAALCAGTYVVNQSDVDAGLVTNIATSTGVAPDGSTISDQDEVTTALPQVPSVDLDKSRIAGDLTPGSTVTYALIVTNTGNVTLADVVVVDSLTDPPVCPEGTLAPGASMTCTADYVVTLADMNAGEILNSATVSTFAPDGSTPVAATEHTTDIEQLPAVEIDKQAPTGVRSVGETLTWTFEITNTGNVTVTDVAVTDPLVDPVDCVDATLEPGATTTCTGTSVVTQFDLDAGQIVNVAEVTATGPAGQVVSADDEVTSGLSQTPVLDIDKQPPAGELTLGATLTWTIIASNNGNVTLTDVSVVDPRLGGPVTCGATVLSPGGSTTCSGTSIVTQADIDAGGISNTAVGQAVAPGGIVVSDDDTVDTPIAESPLAEIVKALTEGRLEVGETVTYTITVTNTGNVTLTDVVVDDPLLGGVVACDVATLAPEGVATCIGTYVVAQGDVDAGLLTNTASMGATSPSGTAIDANASTTVEIDRLPGIDLDKMPPTTPPDAGQTIEYPIAIANTGNVTLTDIAVTDTIADSVTCPARSVAPGDSMTCTAAYTVTQADVDSGAIVNTASVTAISPDGTTVTGEDSIISGIGQTPSIDLDKAPPRGDLATGETITYDLVVTNTGNVTLADIAVDDPMLGGVVLCPAPVLEPGQSTTCTGTYPVTQADLDAGRLDNTATATAVGPDGSIAAATDSVGVSIPTTRLLDVDKIASGSLVVGNDITYTITATNTGTVTLSNVAVSDDLLGGRVDCDAVDLAPGQVATCVGTHTVTQADVDRGQLANQAFGIGTSPSGRLVSDAATAVSTIDQHPSLELTKQITDGDLVTGGTVVYTFVATNTGDVTVTGVAITDTLIADVTCDATTLEPGAATSCSAAYVVTQDDVDAGAIVNFATVAATAPDGSDVGAGTIENSAIEQTSGLDLDKQPPTGEPLVGEQLSYSFVATNTGNVTLTDLQLDDPQLVATPVCDADVLAPGASTICVGTYVVAQDDIDAGTITNTATASAVNPAGDTLTSTDDVIVSIGQESGVDFDKAPPVGTLAAGETLAWTFTVTNTGNVSLSEIAIEDSQLEAAPECAANELAPGESTTCSATSIVTQGQVDAGIISNTATVQTVAADGSTPSMSDNVDTPIAASPLIEASKEVVDGVVALGQTVTWRILVTNTGNVTLDDLVVDDPLLDGNATCASTRLVPPATTACTGTHVVTQADVDAGVITNQAAVSATAPDGMVVNTTAVSTVDIDQIASLELDKPPPVGTLAVGELISWTLTATNNGNVTLTDLVVNDPLSGGQVACATTTLVPGASTDCLTTHVVTQDDVDSGQIVNTANASAIGPNGLTASAADGIVTPIAQGPAIDLNKKTPTGDLIAGETISYTFEVTNIGDVTLDDVSITDPRIAFVNCDARTLEPGATTLCSGDMAITQADVDSGEIVNQASVSASAPGGSVVSSADAVTVPVASSPGIAVDKAIIGGELALGAQLDWLVSVINTGNVTLTDVEVVDSMLAEGVLCTFATIVPEERLTCSGSSTVTQRDIDAGQIVNTASAVATTPIDGIVASSVSLTTQLDPTTDMSLDKQSPSGPVGVGESVTYTFVVTNTGNTTLFDVRIDDPNIADVVCDSIQLAPGEATNCSGEYVLTAEDIGTGGITNAASVTATDPFGEIATASSTDTTNLPEISVTDPIPCSGPISLIAGGGTGPYTLTIVAVDPDGGPTVTLIEAIIDDGEYSQPLDPDVIDGGTYTISYELRDANDLVVSGVYENGLVQHICQPEAQNDIEFGDVGEPVTVDVLANDSSTVVPESVRLVDPDSGDEVEELTVPGEGVWTVNSATGNVTFTPEPGFEENPTPVDYVGSDPFGEEVLGIVQINYRDPEPTPTPVPTPTAVPTPTLVPTPVPTATPAPTSTPEPTTTPEPTATATPEPPPDDLAFVDSTPTPAPTPAQADPTATPEPAEPTATPAAADPTATPEPAEPTATPAAADPTATPEPTAQAQPTAAAQATPTPRPTATAQPTATPQPTAAPIPPPPDNLAFTGSMDSALVALGIIMILAGFAFIVLRRRNDDLVQQDKAKS